MAAAVASLISSSPRTLGEQPRSMKMKDPRRRTRTSRLPSTRFPTDTLGHSFGSHEYGGVQPLGCHLRDSAATAAQTATETALPLCVPFLRYPADDEQASLCKRRSATELQQDSSRSGCAIPRSISRLPRLRHRHDRCHQAYTEQTQRTCRPRLRDENEVSRSNVQADAQQSG